MTNAPANSTLSSPGQAAPHSHVGLWERVSFAIAHAAAVALLYCLSLPGLYRFGRVFGAVEYLINYKRRRRFAAALKRVLNRKPTATERRRATREFFMRTRCDKLFYLVFDRIPRDLAPTLFTIENRTLIDEALAKGQGVYLAMSHHGAQHVIALLLAVSGYKTVGVRDRQEGALRRYVQRRLAQRYPEFAQTRWVFADRFPREIYRALQQGYVVGGALDASRLRNENQKSEEVTVFGEKRRFPSGPMHIAIRCGAVVLQTLVKPEPNFRYRLELISLIDSEQVGDEAADVTRAMRAFAANVEAYVVEAPYLMTKI